MTTPISLRKTSTINIDIGDLSLLRMEVPQDQARED